MAPKLVTDKMLDLFPQQGRLPGRHVSSAIFRVMSRIHPDRFDGSPINQIRANLGNALEHAIIEAMAREHPERYVRPGQIEFDGVLGTPDLWDIGDPDYPDNSATVEIKLTWASSRRATDIEDPWFIRYWWQIKAYAFMAGMLRGRLIIYFVVGDWREGPPVGMMWEDEWTEEELAETFDMIKANAVHEDGATGKIKAKARVATRRIDVSRS